MKQFVRMPSYWIQNKEDPGLRHFSWQGSDKAANIAALMLYIALVHHVNDRATRDFSEPGFTSLSYTDLEEITGISRAKISSGLAKLNALGLINADTSAKTNVYRVCNYTLARGWAKLPLKQMSQGGKHIKFFQDFHLRKRAELDALKLYLLLLAFRDNQNNHAIISYQKINQYTGIPINNIRSAISFLVANYMIQVDQRRDEDFDLQQTKNYYRIVGIGGLHFGNLDQDLLKEK